jgi:hypothetical protein
MQRLEGVQDGQEGQGAAVLQAIGLGFKTPKEAITGNYGAYLPTHAQRAGLLEPPPPARPRSSTQHGSFVACPADRRCLLLLSAVDKKCPFTSNVSIRGRVMTGVVKSTKMNRGYGPSGLPALHQEVQPFREAAQDDRCPPVPVLHWPEGGRHRHDRPVPVRACAQSLPSYRLCSHLTHGCWCRPLSKTVRFNVLRVDQTISGGKQFSGM